MRALLAGTMGLIGLWGCSNPHPEQLAAMAAKSCYDNLVTGRYEHFLDGWAGADSLPADYREQLLTSCQQFMDQQTKIHQGISEVRISNVHTDSLTDYISVFLLLSYADSTHEEIIVPMVEHNGQWRMK